MNLSYYSRLKEQIEEAKKMANPILKKNISIIVEASVEPPGSVEKWENLVARLLHADEWARAGSEAPSLIFVSSTKAYFFFHAPPTSVHALISVVSSLCTRLGNSCCLCVCTSAYLTNEAEVFAYFVLLEEDAYRKQLDKITGKTTEHLTEEEIEKELQSTEKGKKWKFFPGKFYKKMGSARQGKGWAAFQSEDDDTLVYQKKLSFTKFPEQSQQLFSTNGCHRALVA